MIDYRAIYCTDKNKFGTNKSKLFIYFIMRTVPTDF